LLNTLFPCLTHVFTSIVATSRISLSAFAILTGFLHALFNCLSPVSTGGASGLGRALGIVSFLLRFTPLLHPFFPCLTHLLTAVSSAAVSVICMVFMLVAVLILIAVRFMHPLLHFFG
jgi:hypothetical protein